ncbi:MAG: helix-turn-helix domain-containing protein [Chitinophagaceae bacterium]|nr:helix-turn-helix domain-containing protein [Chitinophagaceae bacterium]
MALAFSIAHTLYAGKIIQHFSADVYSPGDPTFLIIAPLSWFYAAELTGQRVKLSMKLLLHFVPFLLIVFFSLSFGSGEPRFLSSFIGDYKWAIYIFFWVMVVAQFSCYQYVIHKKWRAHQKLLQQEVSNTENVNISWIKFFLVVFLIINLFFFFSLFTAIHWESRIWLSKATAIVFSVAILALGFRGILQRDVFDTIIIKDKPPQPEIPVLPVPTKPNQALIDKLVKYMAEKKPFLDPELSLSKLANDLNISRSQLSQLINDGIGENFYDFVNKYRVEEVKRLMADPEMVNFSLLGIAFEGGFKSKSTFNLIFKRFTGLTPTQYRKNISG